MAPGAGGKFGAPPPCSKLRSFGSKCTVLKTVLVTLLGLFGAPRSHLALGELYPLPPSLRLCLRSNFYTYDKVLSGKERQVPMQMSRIYILREQKTFLRTASFSSCWFTRIRRYLGKSPTAPFCRSRNSPGVVEVLLCPSPLQPSSSFIVGSFVTFILDASGGVGLSVSSRLVNCCCSAAKRRFNNFQQNRWGGRRPTSSSEALAGAQSTRNGVNFIVR